MFHRIRKFTDKTSNHPSGQDTLQVNSTGSNHENARVSMDVHSVDNMGIAETPHTTPKNLKHLRNLSSNSLTFAAQKDLPRLPIPALERTLKTFPAVLEGIQDEEQQAETKRVVREFLEGPGPELQKALIEYEKKGIESGQFGSYVEEWWNESYLAPDASVVLNLNPYFVLSELPDPKISKDQISCAASLTFSSLKIASLLKHETLSPDYFKGKPLCMDQFRALFGSSRQPTKHSPTDGLDEIHVYSDSSHVVVLCKNQFYYFPALWPDSGHVAVDENDIRDILKAIETHASQSSQEESSKSAIGVFTSLSRSEWAQARFDLIKSSPKNATALHIIDSALFILVLDDFTPPTLHAAAANMLHGTNRLAEDSPVQVGTCINRWYDKLQLIVCKDGTTGINFEHSSIDGHTALRFVSDMFAETVITFAESIVELVHGRGRIQHIVEATIQRAAVDKGRRLDVLPKKIRFDIPDTVMDQIYYAETSLCDNVVSSDTFVLEFAGYGKNLIVKNNMSPDSFVQMSIMLAYYRLYGKLVCTYEPVLTKAFYHGRTEAMRSATPQAKALCQVWCRPDSTAEEKLAALRLATVEHSRLVKECAAGFGVDRHLFALKCIAARKGLPMPAFFQSEAWAMLNHTILSTSNCGNPSLRLFGFGPVVPDGFGIGYIIKDHGINYSVSSKHRQTLRYVRCLETTLQALHELLTPLSNVRVDHRPTLREVEGHIHTMHAETTYDDMYGETSFIPRTSLKHLEAVLHEDEPFDSRVLPPRRLERRESKQFYGVQTRSQSNDFLLDPEVLITVSLGQNGDE